MLSSTISGNRAILNVAALDHLKVGGVVAGDRGKIVGTRVHDVGATRIVLDDAGHRLDVEDRKLGIDALDGLPHRLGQDMFGDIGQGEDARAGDQRDLDVLRL